MHLLPDVKILANVAPPAIPDDVLRAIDSIWETELQRRGVSLFNGKLFSVESTAPGTITGWLSEYRLFLAQRRKPDLFHTLKIRPLALTGLLRCEGAVVIGQRSYDVEQDAGSWELVPSGGIDGATNPDGSINLEQHFYTELEEEIGIRSEQVSGPPLPFVLVESSESHVCDIGLSFTTTLSNAQIFSTFNNLENREYLSLRTLPLDELERSNISSVSKAIIAAAMPFLRRER